ncbi:MAG: anthranilate phosphoribosyltransferase [Candidatus Omnitrophica bacterium]|nr:anthranilate phosphoribosyltransferase [Candidatus Omnitrophota bacterium]MDD5487467.1 anthranilate phosphoribosyltransferase [Candidatus Omnitrophota bacterium]
MSKMIEKVVTRTDLDEKETFAVFDHIMTGKATPAQIASFITALRIKGETVDEITGAARVMRQRSLKINAGSGNEPVIDTCGTGGTGKNTFNISTTAAFVVAGCGVKVAKHGNRAASGRCGSADVLEKLGVGIDVPLKVSEKCLKEIGICFMFAPLYHGAMKYAVAPRKEIGIRTIFNLLGPLCNPAQADCQVMGVCTKNLTELMAGVLKRLGSKRAYVVHGSGHLDELSISGLSLVSELKGGRIRSYYLNPGAFGLRKAPIEAIKGGSARANARMVKAVLSGKKGPHRDIVLMNASLALMAAGKVHDLKEGVKMAGTCIDSGRALEKLAVMAKMTSAGTK